MKKLTGRAAEDFKGWLFSTRNEIIKVGVMEYDLYYMFMYMLPETCQNALIIEWFDLVGIYICIEPYTTLKNKFVFTYYILHHKNISEQNTYANRNSVTHSAIEKANELYNLNN